MIDDTDTTVRESGPDRKFLMIGAPIVIVILVVMALVTTSFNSGLAPGEEKNSFGAANMTNGIETQATINNVDPTKAEMTVRLTMKPIGSLADSSELLAKPVTLYYDSADGTKQIDFKAGKPLGSTDLTVPLLDGTISSYPWDKYKGGMQIEFVTVGGLEASSSNREGGGSTPKAPPTTDTHPTTEVPTSTSPPGTTTPPSADPGVITDPGPTPFHGINGFVAAEPEPTPATAASATTKAAEAKPDTIVPATMSVFENVPAYNMIDVKGSANADGVLSVHFDVSRNSATLFFSGVVTLIMWGLALGVFCIALSVAVRRRKLELAQITMMAAILFALPAALRGSQPGIPPPGVLSDFYGFFFCDVIVAVSLITIVITYLKRRPE